MNKKQIFLYVICSPLLVVPTTVFAHGDVDDGHVEGVVTSGASALLQAFSPTWWGLLGVSALLTALLSFGIWRFLRVAPTKKPDATPATPLTEIKK